MRKIFIQSAEQISIQKPLCDEWMDTPEIYSGQYARSIDPNFKQYLSPTESRRLGKILKRALVTSVEAIRNSHTDMPDAIITGTGLGCIENTELFLSSLCNDGEQLLKPTYFMQSTHNTISSLISIHTGNHGYNVTYSQKGLSFDSALFDAWLQMQMSKIDSALVGGHDEMTPSYFTLLQRIGYVGGDMQGVCGECAVSFMLTADSDDAMCQLCGIKMMYHPSADMLRNALSTLLAESGLEYNDIDYVMTGVNGKNSNDDVYRMLVEMLFPEKPLLRYKNVFGECYASSGLGLYAAASCLKRNFIPQFLRYGDISSKQDDAKNILLINQYENKMFSLIILKSTCCR
jgi:3-oxoacyl-[acyl-carrier-protein] synthase II